MNKTVDCLFIVLEISFAAKTVRSRLNLLHKVYCYTDSYLRDLIKVWWSTEHSALWTSLCLMAFIIREHTATCTVIQYGWEKNRFRRCWRGHFTGKNSTKTQFPICSSNIIFSLLLLKPFRWFWLYVPKCLRVICFHPNTVLEMENVNSDLWPISNELLNK